MRKTVFEVGVAIAAAAVVYAVVSLTDSLAPTFRWILAAGVAVIAFVVAWFAGRRLSESRGGVDIANRNQSRGELSIDDVVVDPGSPDVRIGSDNRSTGDMRLTAINVGRRKHPK